MHSEMIATLDKYFLILMMVGEVKVVSRLAPSIHIPLLLAVVVD